MSPRLGLGCVALGSAASGRSLGDDVRFVGAALDRGVTLFDSADVYASGNSERVLGRALRSRRDDVVIATKGGYLFRERTAWEQSARRIAKDLGRRVPSRRGASGGAASAGGSYASQDFSPAHLRSAVEASLRRLQTDRIDVYQLHGPRQPDPELLRGLQDLVTAGKVRRFGVGAEDVAWAAAWVGIDEVEVVQLPFGMLDPEAATTVFPLARQRAVELWARGVLGGGVLKAAAEDPASLADHPKRALIERLSDVAGQAGIGVDQLALGFVRAHGDDLATILIGTSSLDHLERSLQLIKAPPLPDDVLGAVRSALADGHAGHERSG